MTTVVAAVARTKFARLTIETLTIDEPRADEVLVRIAGTGVCHTDMVVRDQGYAVPLPVVLGHEGAGIVERVGPSVTTVKPGDHVVLSFGHCGSCANCKLGRPGFCKDFYEKNFKGSRMDGSYALHDKDGKAVGSTFFSQSSFCSHALVSEQNAIRIRQDVPLEIMGPLGCGIQTGAGAVLNTLKPPSASSIAIFGAGTVGLSAALAAKIVGCTTIILIDLHDSRLDLAKELGATHTINAARVNTVEEIKRVSLKGGVDFSLECTGHGKVFRQAVDCLAIPGKCGLIGAADMGAEVSLDINTVLFGKTIVGIIEGDSVPSHFIPQLIDLWKAGLFPFDKLVKFYDLNDINEAIADSESGRVLKPIVRPS